MASIHVSEIQAFLAERGEPDATLHGAEGFFLEIRFDDPARAPSSGVDPEFQDRVITADCPFGVATIQFDHEGQLRSIDLS